MRLANFFNRSLAFYFLSSLSNCLELIKVNDTLLTLWYDVLANCMLNHPDLEYPQALESCWDKVPGRGFYSLPTEGSLSEDFQGHCCTLDMPLLDRGFDLGSLGIVEAKHHVN